MAAPEISTPSMHQDHRYIVNGADWWLGVSRDPCFPSRCLLLHRPIAMTAVCPLGDLVKRLVWIGAVADDVESSVDADDDVVGCCARRKSPPTIRGTHWGGNVNRAVQGGSERLRDQMHRSEVLSLPKDEAETLELGEGAVQNDKTDRGFQRRTGNRPPANAKAS